MAFSDVRKCGARTRAGGRCEQPSMRNGRCRMHGGKSPTGLAHPRTVTGRYSRDMPTRMLSRFQDAMYDTELLSLREELALITARISERLADLAGEHRPDWDEVTGKVGIIDACIRTGDLAKLEREVEELAALLHGRQGDDAIFRDIRDLIDRRARLVRAETRRLVALKQMLTVEQVIVLAQTIAEVMRRHIKDQATLSAINREFRQILDLPDTSISSVRRSGSA
jgi:hypothetical protein